MDTVFIKGVVLLTMVNNTIKFRDSAYVIERSHEEYYRDLDLVIRKYNDAGPSIKTIHRDGVY